MVTYTGEYKVVSCAYIDSDIETRVCISEGVMVALLALVSNNMILRFLGGLNGLIGNISGRNYNCYIDPPHKKLIFPCILFLLFLSVKYPPL